MIKFWNQVVAATPTSQGFLSFANLISFLVSRVVPALIFFVVIWLLSKLTRRIVDSAMRRRHMPADVRLLVLRAIYLGGLALGLFTVIATILVDANTALWGVIGAALVAGLGLQDIFKDYVSGFYLLLERKVRVGDVVEIGAYKGVVTDIKMRVTYLRDDGRLVIVPNSQLFGQAAAISAPSGDPPAAERPSEVASVGEGSEDHAG